MSTLRARGRILRHALAGPAWLAALAIAAGACTGGTAGASPAASVDASAPASVGSSEATSASAEPTAVPGGTLRLYASVTQDTVDAVIAAFGQVAPGVSVEVFRAPTGELAARIAAELREGGLQADVLWLADPLSMSEYADQGLLLEWEPSDAESLDEAYRTSTSWGTRILNVVMVRGSEVAPEPTTWSDLADAGLRDGVALPDPSFAGSAFGALGYFALAPDYGMEFYRALHDNGAVQLKAPDEVVTGVAEGRFRAGITLDRSVRAARDKGSPIELAWPSDGAIAVHSPIAVVAGSDGLDAARAFVEHVLSRDGQAAIASTGWQPALPGVGGPEPEGAQVVPDWAAAIGRREALLDDYRAIFGG